MKIVLATGIFPPDIGGPALYCQNLTKEFSQLGHKVRIITYGHGNEKEVIYISRSWPNGLRQFIYFLKLSFASIRSNFILAFDSLGAGLPAVLIGIILRKKVVIRLGGDFLWEKHIERENRLDTISDFYSKNLSNNFSLLKKIISFTLQHASKVAFTTNFQAEIFIKNYYINKSKTVVIGNIFQKRGFASNGFEYNKILWAGRFIKLKNLEFLLKIFLAWHKKRPDLFLKLIGDGPEKYKIRNLVNELGLTKKVELSDSLPAQLIEEEIKTSFFCVLPSLSEISPNFALQCISFGVPIILTSECGFKESFPELLYADPKKLEGFVNYGWQLFNADFYKNYKDKLASIKYRKSFFDLAKEYINLL